MGGDFGHEGGTCPLCPVIVVSHFLIVFGSLRFLINFFSLSFLLLFSFLSLSKFINCLLWASIHPFSTSYEGISIVFCSIFCTKFRTGKNPFRIALDIVNVIFLFISRTLNVRGSHSKVHHRSSDFLDDDVQKF